MIDAQAPPKIYDVTTDEIRVPSQADLDQMQLSVQLFGATRELLRLVVAKSFTPVGCDHWMRDQLTKVRKCIEVMK